MDNAQHEFSYERVEITAPFKCLDVYGDTPLVEPLLFEYAAETGYVAIFTGGGKDLENLLADALCERAPTEQEIKYVLDLVWTRAHQ